MYRLPAVLFSVGIVVTSSQPAMVPQPFSFADKVYHFFGYMLYGSTLILAMRTMPITDPRRFWWAVVIGLVFAATDELHQAFVPGRSADVLDWCADALGIGLAVTIAAVRKPYANS